MDCSPPGSSVHVDSPSKNTSVGCHALLQVIFPTHNWTQVSCTAGGFFTDWATREAQIKTSAAAAKSLQSCLTLCDPIDSSPPGSTVPGILQARTLEWLPFPSPMHESKKWKWRRSVVSDSETPWTAAYQASLSMGFSRQESWSGLHCLLYKLKLAITIYPIISIWVKVPIS